MKSYLFKRLVSIFSLFSLAVNSIITPAYAIAQEITPTEEVTTEESVTTEETTDETAENTEPTETATPTPEIVEEETSEETDLTPTVTILPTPTSTEADTKSDENAEETESVISATVVQEPEISDLAGALEEESSASITTDQSDYSPTGIVVVTATDLNPSTEYRIVFSSAEPYFYYFEDMVTTDESGTLVYTHQLDGTYRPDYLLELYLGETLVASTTFTDAPPAANLDQCRNGASGSPISPCNWVNGNVGSSNSHYVEGYSIPYRAILTDLPLNTSITLTLGYDIKNSDAHAIDYLTHFNRLEPHLSFGHSAETIDPTIGVSGLSATTTTFPIPAPSSAGSPVAGQPTDSFNSLPAGEKVFTLFGGTITGVSYVTEGDLSVAQSETRINVIFTVDSETAVLSWGGHIGSRLDWGYDNGTPRSAGGISGSPYHMRLIDWSLKNLGNQDRSLSAGAVIPPGNLTIIKHIEPSDASVWDFSITGTNFNQDVLGLPDQGQETLSVIPGSYTISEFTDPNYLTSVSCTTGDLGTDSVTVDVPSGESVVCTFTNTLNVGTIILEKQTDPDGSQQIFDFVGYVAGPLSDGQQIVMNDVLAGQYQTEELVPPDWDLTDITCIEDVNSDSTFDLQSHTVTFNVSPGETVHCTFTNTLKRGTLTIEKDVIPDDTSSWDFLVQGPNFYGAHPVLQDGDSVTLTDLLPGGYTIDETTDPAYSTVFDCGIKGSGNGNLVRFDILPGEDVTCKYTNTKLGKIIIEKQTDPDGASGDFSFNGDLGGTIQDGGTIESVYLQPGSYSVTESSTLGFDLTNISCDDGNSLTPSTVDLGQKTANYNLDPGETITCTFTNTQRGSISGYKYEDIDGTNNLYPVDNWLMDLYQCADFNIDCTTLVDSQYTDTSGFYSFDDLIPGYYKVIEESVLGWTNITPTEQSLTLDPGENETDVNFTNAQYTTIIVEKQIIGTPDQGDSFEFSGDVSGFAYQSGDQLTSSNLLPGTYTVYEVDPSPKYELTSISCDDGQSLIPSTHDLNSGQATFNVEQGETVTCTFTNTKQAKIIVEKQTLPDGSNESFEFRNSYSSNFNLTDGQTNDSGYLTPGSYSVFENTPSGWDLTSTTCDNKDTPDNISLAAGDIVNCTFENTQRGSVTIIKDAIPDSGVNFTFTGGLGTFYLDDDTDPTYPNSETFDNLTPGLYQVDEGFKSDWDLTSLICTDPTSNSRIDLSGQSAYINVDPGDDITCTFENTRRARIRVDKITDPSGDPESFDFELTGPNSVYDQFGLKDTDSPYSTGYSLLPGSGYSVSELTPAGWDLTNSYCSDQSDPSNISLDPGESVTCTFENTKRGSIKVTKYTDPSSDTTTDFDFNGDLGGFTLTGNGDNQTFDNLLPGDYQINELVTTGWDLTNTSCTGETNFQNGDSVNLSPGENIECEFTNTQLGKIYIQKLTDPQGSQEIFDFISNFDQGVFSLSDGQIYESSFLPAGNYSVIETVPSGWDLTSETCGNGDTPDNINLGVGESVRCFFENTQKGHLIVDKTTVPSSNELFTINATGSGTITSPNQRSISDGGSEDFEVTPGTYSVYESYNPNWIETSNSCFDVQVNAGETKYCSIVNTEIVKDISIEKVNDGPQKNPGDNVTYTLTVTNNGNIPIYDVYVYDALPGGFTYVANSTVITGATTVEPTISGSTLKWSVGTLNDGDQIVITYEAEISSDLEDGTYRNFATCEGLLFGEFIREEQLETIECNVDDSDVVIGIGQTYGGNLEPQVLGISTELPATGSDTLLVLAALAMITAGFKVRSFGKRRKYE